MTQFQSGVTRLSVLALTAAVAAGCDTVGPEGTGNVQVTMQKIASATATQALVDGFASAADGSYGSIDAGDVMSLTMQLDSIQFLLADANGGGWITLVLAVDPEADPVVLDPVELDLKALPTDDAPLTIAVGDLTRGSYQSVRLFVSGAMIVFDIEVSVGGFTLAAGDSHPVTIPSGEQTGLKTDLAFIVDASTTVNLFFDEDATFRNVTATGSEKVILTPVLRNSSGDGGT